MKTFKEWIKIKESCTDTGNVASFARPIGAVSRRMYPEPVIMNDEKKKKNAKKD